MKKEIKRVKRERVYQGTIVDVYKDYMEFSNGNHEVWDYIHHKGAAAVIPVMDDGRLLMVRQYRNALDRFTLELPAGGLNQADEPGRDCSARELEEETGYHGEYPEWLHHKDCLTCFTCYHHCPHHAIEFGHQTQKKGQYFYK